jgi:pimeloyl-ACP methyl ester carboxylesterase
VFAPDLRGHGDSAWSADGQYTPAALADDLGEAVQVDSIKTRVSSAWNQALETET